MSINRREFIIVGGVGTIGAIGTIGCGNGNPTPPVDPATTPKAQTHLTVKFSGLIGMVSQTSGTDFVLVDGSATLNEPHVPRLLAPQGSVGTGSLPPTGTHADGRVFWDLKNQRVTLTSGADTGTTKAPGRDPVDEVEKPKSPNSHRDASWVAQMSKIPAAGTGKINPVCLANDPREAKVASRVRFNGGEIFSRFKPAHDQFVWQIGADGPPKPFRQALSELSILQKIPLDHVNFKLEAFDGGTQPDIVLIPTTGVTLDIEVENLPSTAVPCTNPADGNNLQHFKAYYQLLDPPLATGPIPSCSTNCPNCPSAGDFIFCPPAEYQP